MVRVIIKNIGNWRIWIHQFRFGVNRVFEYHENLGIVYKRVYDRDVVSKVNEYVGLKRKEVDKKC